MGFFNKKKSAPQTPQQAPQPTNSLPAWDMNRLLAIWQTMTPMPMVDNGTGNPKIVIPGGGITIIEQQFVDQDIYLVFHGEAVDGAIPATRRHELLDALNTWNAAGHEVRGLIPEERLMPQLTNPDEIIARGQISINVTWGATDEQLTDWLNRYPELIHEFWDHIKAALS